MHTIFFMCHWYTSTLTLDIYLFLNVYFPLLRSNVIIPLQTFICSQRCFKKRCALFVLYVFYFIILYKILVKYQLCYHLYLHHVKVNLTLSTKTLVESLKEYGPRHSVQHGTCFFHVPHQIQDWWVPSELHQDKECRVYWAYYYLYNFLSLFLY